MPGWWHFRKLGGIIPSQWPLEDPIKVARPQGVPGGRQEVAGGRQGVPQSPGVSCSDNIQHKPPDPELTLAVGRKQGSNVQYLMCIKLN